jgi:hypothetical protein
MKAWLDKVEKVETRFDKSVDWVTELFQGKSLWVICQTGAGILLATKIGIGWAILLEIVATFLIIGAVEVWKPKEPSRYTSIDTYAKEFGGMMRSKRYTKAQLNKKAYDILDRYTDMQFRDDPQGYMERL